MSGLGFRVYGLLSSCLLPFLIEGPLIKRKRRKKGTLIIKGLFTQAPRRFQGCDVLSFGCWGFEGLGF